jgi:hypothetical protein
MPKRDEERKEKAASKTGWRMRYEIIACPASVE